jgi:hypothetical protein
MERHLPAFEPALPLEPGTRLRPLVPASGGLPVAGALSAADALLLEPGPLGGLEIAEIHLCFL